MNHQNNVELVGCYGSDLTHAQSAWTSTDRELTEDKLNRYPELLKFLAKEGHETPFEKSSLHFLVTAEIASHIHVIKHRIAVSVNAESARYKELKDDKYYVPQDWPEVEKVKFKSYCFDAFQEYHTCIDRLVNNHGFSRKRAKESARFYLPYSNQIKFDIMFNFRSFVHFQRLRNSEHSQVEIREIAQEMLRLIVDLEDNPFKYSMEAFNL
jgi:thymidylate synthase (FAD)